MNPEHRQEMERALRQGAQETLDTLTALVDLIRLAHAQGMSVEEISDATGHSPSAIDDWLKGA